MSVVITVSSCNGQPKNEVCKPKTIDSSIAKKIPRGICVPEAFTVDQVIQDIDFNRDNSTDIILRYGVYPLTIGSIRHYGFFQKTSDSTYLLKKELSNITLPFVNNIFAAASGKDSTAFALINTYPYDLSVEFIADTIKLSHLIPEYYGKTHVFVFEKRSGTWLLQKTNYWIGGIDPRDIDRLDISKKLEGRNILEIKTYENKAPIEKFNLKESRKAAYTEEKDYFMIKFDLFEWSQSN